MDHMIQLGGDRDRWLKMLLSSASTSPTWALEPALDQPMLQLCDKGCFVTKKPRFSREVAVGSSFTVSSP